MKMRYMDVRNELYFLTSPFEQVSDLYTEPKHTFIVSIVHKA
jgi:hypothetical protein